VHKSKTLIEDQKEELTSLNQNLEAVVLQRTQILEEQNQKLKDYAFYNAHTLRGPFCRIKGLVHLRQLVNDEDLDAKEINTRLIQSLNV
jgi:light-regulated signal transduction histidine kinase (bacteriophytochrome)